jgi:type IV secretion system protein VirB1
MMPSLDMMQICAPNVAPPTLAAIIRVESGGNPFALGINGPVGHRPRPRSAAEAAQLARDYICRGYSVDLGLMQINSRNLPGLGYTVEEMLEPCTNLRAGSRILSRGYAGAVKRFGPGQAALRAALSAYNTGNYEQGFKNGYVAKYDRGRGVRVVVRSAPMPHLAIKVAASKAAPPGKSLADMPSNPYFADTTVYKRSAPP